MNSATVLGAASRRAELRWLPAIAIWAILLTAPLWLPLLGGYTALAGRVLVRPRGDGIQHPFGLHRGDSFGHAAYFGLGAYAPVSSLKFLAASTPLAICLARCLAVSRGRCSVC